MSEDNKEHLCPHCEPAGVCKNSIKTDAKTGEWVVEDIGSHANILVFDSSKDAIEMQVVGIGFPPKLAKNIVNLHNNAVNEALSKCKIVPNEG